MSFPPLWPRPGDVFARLLNRSKPRLFVSYQHSNDQGWYDLFVSTFGDAYELFSDNSVDRAIRSEATMYLDRRIREEYISGTSITVVLCGSETWKRKFVDWELHATLDKEHALLAIVLPTAARLDTGRVILPSRLQDNLDSRFAHAVLWPQRPEDLSTSMMLARLKARETRSIVNVRPQMTRNLP